MLTTLYEYLPTFPILYSLAVLFWLLHIHTKNSHPSRHRIIRMGEKTLTFFILYASLLSFLQFIAWQQHPISQYLLPPHQPFGYFLGYAYLHFFSELALRIGAAIACTTILWLADALLRHRILYESELPSVFLVMIILPWPANATYFFLTLFAASIAKLIANIVLRYTTRERMSMRMWWPRLALLFYLATPLFLKTTLADQFRIIRPFFI